MGQNRICSFWRKMAPFVLWQTYLADNVFLEKIREIPFAERKLSITLMLGQWIVLNRLFGDKRAYNDG